MVEFHENSKIFPDKFLHIFLLVAPSVTALRGQPYLQIDHVRISTSLYCICSVPIIKIKLLDKKNWFRAVEFPQECIMSYLKYCIEASKAVPTPCCLQRNCLTITHFIAQFYEIKNDFKLF